MDEVGFDLATTRRTRRVAPRTSSSKAQASLATSDHITVIATISTSDAPVPPFVIYKGGHVIEEWMATVEKQPRVMADVTDSGYSNSYMTIRWLKDCFDPTTKGRADGQRRLLFLDGPDIHTSVDFLEACGERNIVPIVLPANLSAIFQPLDVDFFHHLKLAYHRQVDDYQLGSKAGRVSKAYFGGWFQRAWQETATSRQIRSAWAKAHLYPPSEVDKGRPITPDRQDLPGPRSPETPHTSQASQAIDRMFRRNEISPGTAYRKFRKGFDQMAAKNVLLEKDLERREAAEKLDRAARGSNKRQRFPQGHLFDSEYAEDHAQELAARKVVEEGRKAAKRRPAQARRQQEASKPVQEGQAGPSTRPEER